MLRCAALVTIALWSAAAVAANNTSAPLFAESGGIVVIEVESAPNGNWKEGTELTGFTGRCYFTNGGSKLVYRILITRPGKYNLRIHNRHDHPDHTLQNDCFTQMDGGRRVKTFSSKRGEWTWHSVHEHSHSSKIPASYELDVGIHTFVVSGRSMGFSIDRFHFYMDDVKNPLDTSRRESRSGPPEMADLVHLKRVNSYIAAGKIGMAYSMADKKRDDKDSEVAAEAQRVCEVIGGYVDSRIREIERVKPLAPVQSVGLLANLAASLSGTKRSTEIRNMARAWSQEPATKNAAKAAAIYAQIDHIAKPLKANSKLPEQQFARKYRQQIASITRYALFLRQKYPETPACTKALNLADKLSISLDQ